MANIQSVFSFMAAFGTIVTAFATVALCYVTIQLAKQSKRLADLSNSPLITADLRPNPWAIQYFDLYIENTGNASAFNIEIEFDPPLVSGGHRSEKGIPLQNISLLNPKGVLSSSITQYVEIRDIVYTVTTSWTNSPDSERRNALIYKLDMSLYKEISHLGARSPEVSIADTLKKMREDWQWISKGSRKLKVDVYDKRDRHGEYQQMLEAHEGKLWKRTASKFSNAFKKIFKKDN